MGSANRTSVTCSRLRPRSVLFDVAPGAAARGIAMEIRGLGSGGAFFSSCAEARRRRAIRVLHIEFLDGIALREDLDRAAVRRLEPPAVVDPQRVIDRRGDVGRL